MVRFAIFFGCSSSVLLSTAASITSTLFHQTLLLLPHLHSLCARCRAPGYDSVNFQHFGHRCPSSMSPHSLSPAGPPSCSSLYIFLLSLLHVEYPHLASSQARQIAAPFPSF